MNLTIKRKEGTKWKGVPVSEVVGTTLYRWMLAAENDVVAALKDGDNEICFVSNSDEWVTAYKERALSLHVRDLAELMGARDDCGVLIHCFPEAELTEVKIESENHGSPALPSNVIALPKRTP